MHRLFFRDFYQNELEVAVVSLGQVSERRVFTLVLSREQSCRKYTHFNGKIRHFWSDLTSDFVFFSFSAPFSFNQAGRFYREIVYSKHCDSAIKGRRTSINTIKRTVFTLNVSFSCDLKTYFSLRRMYLFWYASQNFQTSEKSREKNIITRI